MTPGAPIVLGLLFAVGAAAAGDGLPGARALLLAWHEDPRRIDRARALLEAAATADPAPETLVELARVWFLTGDFRARGDGERVEAYMRGSEAARRAVAAAPDSDRAHLWLAINTGRLAELRGIVGAVGLLATLREASATVLRLNPSSVDGLIVAGGLAAELPPLLGGDRTRAEALFRRALAADPHQTGGRLELARLYLATRRWRDAGRELQRVVGEPAPTDLPRWTVSDMPRARAMLTDLYERGRLTGPPQAP
ncbi:MAG TPA: tetratricopeptide repeat protein [Methylomirabilota bacterium]|nr:tetratricopeptide repeat protein [Methylomirabilota bacterium]